MSSERKIVEYTILWEGNESKLVQEVMTFLKEGRQPIGGTSAISRKDFTSQHIEYMQAMVKYE